MKPEIVKIGKRGTIVIPALLRTQFKFHEGDLVIAEEYDGGILLRPAVTLPVEHYTLERQAEFLLSNAVDKADYDRIVLLVKNMGLNPDFIPHHKPAGVKKHKK